MDKSELISMNKASCRICLLSETNCPICTLKEYKMTATIIEVRTVEDCGRMYRVADVMEHGAVLPHSVVLYEIRSWIIPEPEQLPTSFLAMSPRVGECQPWTSITPSAAELAKRYDWTPDESMPIIDMDKIDEIKF